MKESVRKSNIELFRIISMCFIIGHHYVVNSGLLDVNGPIYNNILSYRSLITLVLGAWGKTAINCFVLISGYFMCRSSITIAKFLKLIGEVYFYSFIINCLFWITGYSSFSIKSFGLLFLPINQLKGNFTGSFLLFFLFIPFLNLLIKNMDERQHAMLIILALFAYCILGTVKRVNMNYLSWFIVLYFISSFLRLYPKEIFDNKHFWGIMLLLSILLSIASIMCCSFLVDKYGVANPYFFVEDSNTFLALTNGLCGFMFFKNITLPYNKYVNAIASTTFGVLLIHANSDTMRQWLWKTVLDNTVAFYKSWYFFHFFGSVVAIFIVCMCIDLVRIRYVEKPFMRFVEKEIDILKKKYINKHVEEA